MVTIYLHSLYQWNRYRLDATVYPQHGRLAFHYRPPAPSEAVHRGRPQYGRFDGAPWW